MHLLEEWMTDVMTYMLGPIFSLLSTTDLSGTYLHFRVLFTIHSLFWVHVSAFKVFIRNTNPLNLHLHPVLGASSSSFALILLENWTQLLSHFLILCLSVHSIWLWPLHWNVLLKIISSHHSSHWITLCLFLKLQYLRPLMSVLCARFFSTCLS